MNKNLLRSIMVLHGDTNIKLAKELGISQQTLSAKMNETNGAEFIQSEIRKISEIYNLTNDDVCNIFFA